MDLVNCTLYIPTGRCILNVAHDQQFLSCMSSALEKIHDRQDRVQFSDTIFVVGRD